MSVQDFNGGHARAIVMGAHEACLAIHGANVSLDILDAAREDSRVEEQRHAGTLVQGFTMLRCYNAAKRGSSRRGGGGWGMRGGSEKQSGKEFVRVDAKKKLCE
jgi:hypothetical protein